MWLVLEAIGAVILCLVAGWVFLHLVRDAVPVAAEVMKCHPNHYPRPPVYHTKYWWAGHRAGYSQYRKALQVMVAVLGSAEAVKQFLINDHPSVAGVSATQSPAPV